MFNISHIDTFLLKLVVEKTVLVLSVLCIPVSGLFLFLQRKELRLDRPWKIVISPLVYVIFGLLSLAVFSIVHDINTFPKWSIHHQGLLLVFPIFFLLAAKILKTDTLSTVDALSVSLPGIVAITRLFCFVRGCCYGTYCFDTQFRWPIREAVIIINFLCCIVFLIWNKKEHKKFKLVR